MESPLQTYQTYWVRKGAPSYYFDDYVFFRAGNEQFQMLQDEFEFLFKQMHDNCRQENTSKYIQIIKAWNELTGFAGDEQKPFIIEDMEDTIQAVRLAVGSGQNRFPGIHHVDLEQLIHFLERNQKGKIEILLD